jgi:hypothetical protein
MAKPPRILPLLAACSCCLVAWWPNSAQAGLLRPLLVLMRPQLENRLARVCLETAGGGQPALEQALRDPCRKLAVPTSKCLIEETDSTGRGLGVLSEMLAGRFGDDSEVVVKRCIARMFGLPAESLRDVPLQELGKRFGGRGLPGGGTAPPAGPTTQP